jgi:hypothetical protein
LADYNDPIFSKKFRFAEKNKKEKEKKKRVPTFAIATAGGERIKG